MNRTRKGLPLIFELDSGIEEVMAGHDTGTEANHMSLELAQKLGYKISETESDQGQFQLPNGKIINALGRVTAQVQFAQGEGSRTSTFTCFFNVFPSLALPALIGMAFLNATETLTAYRCRLANLPTGWKRSLRLCAVGNATNQVTCVLNGREVKATADTGAEIALVSGGYALRHGLLREYSCEELEFADGSREYTSGFADVSLAMQIPRSYGYKWTTKTVRFHVLKSLTFDVILDEDIVEDFSIFQNGISSLLITATEMISSLGPIAHLGTVEKAALKTSDRLKEWATSLFTSESKSSPSPQPNITTTSQLTTTTSPQPTSTVQITRAQLLKEISALDKAELQRRAQLRKQKSFTMSEANYHTGESKAYKEARQKLLSQIQALPLV